MWGREGGRGTKCPALDLQEFSVAGSSHRPFLSDRGALPFLCLPVRRCLVWCRPKSLKQSNIRQTIKRANYYWCEFACQLHFNSSHSMLLGIIKLFSNTSEKIIQKHYGPCYEKKWSEITFDSRLKRTSFMRAAISLRTTLSTHVEFNRIWRQQPTRNHHGLRKQTDHK